MDLDKSFSAVSIISNASALSLKQYALRKCDPVSQPIHDFFTEYIPSHSRFQSFLLSDKLIGPSS